MFNNGFQPSFLFGVSTTECPELLSQRFPLQLLPEIVARGFDPSFLREVTSRGFYHGPSPGIFYTGCSKYLFYPMLLPEMFIRNFLQQ